MRKKPKYPLEQVALIKQKRLEEAEKLLKEKKEILEKEKEKLSEAKKKLANVKKLKEDKMREYFKEMEKGTTSDKIKLHETYIKDVVDEQLKSEKKKVADQKEEVKKAEEALEAARKDRLQKNQEMEKMRLHRKEWEKEVALEEMRQDVIDNDELGSNIHTMRNRGKKREL